MQKKPKEEAAAANAKAAAAGEGKADGASADGKKFTDDDIKGSEKKNHKFINLIFPLKPV